jgi:4-amino-4-deoxy-L-arabinose transferase-like glycosyltransferase
MSEPAVTARPFRFAQAVVAILLAIRLTALVVMPPIGDEAYYWMWGQKLGWSYFDHPPLHAWLLHVMGLVFGWNYFSLRGLTLFTLAGTLWIFWLWSKRLKPADPAAWFWPSAALYLASPLYFLMGSIAFHDHLLIFLCIASAHCFLMFAERWEADRRGLGWLYGGAILLGLAVLTKYNGVLIGFGVAVFFIVHRPMRSAWRSPHLYLAALLAVAMQAPVLWWNLTESFASYNFHLSERWGGSFGLSPIHLLIFIVQGLVLVSPFLFPAIFSMMRRPLGAPFADRARALALSAFWASTLVMGFLSLFVETYFYWNITAFLLLMPLLAGWISSRGVLILHLVYGLVLIAVFTFNNLVIPIGNLTGGMDWTIASTYGWPDVASRIRTLKKEHEIGFVAATRYTTAAQLGYALHDPDVTDLARRHDQYDYWFDPTAHKGQDALVVSDPQLGIKAVSPLFDSFEKLETLPVERFGMVIYQPTIYLGKGFRGQTPN